MINYVSYMQEAIELIKSKHWLYTEMDKNLFNELNVFCIGGIRISGKTTAMKKMFDPNKDIYISPRATLSKEFLKNTYTSDFFKTVFEWDDNALKIINERNAVLSMNMASLQHKLKHALKEDSIIFLDVFSVEVPDNHKHVKTITDILYSLSLYGDVDISKNILIYT